MSRISAQIRQVTRNGLLLCALLLPGNAASTPAAGMPMKDGSDCRELSATKERANCPAAPSQAAGARVELFSPTGTVKKVRQVTVRFSAPMVPFGDPRQASPFTVACPQPGQGRWIDDRNWSYDFDQPLPGGVRCTFDLSPDVRTLEGAAVTGETRFAFSTGGPAVVATWPQENSYVDEEQHFILKLDAPADPASIMEHAACQLVTGEERVGVEVLEGEARQEALNARKDLSGFRHSSSLTPTFSERDHETRLHHTLQDEQALFVVLRCREKLPSARRFLLKWGAGIRSPNGATTETPQLLSYETRAPFSFTLHCPQEKSLLDQECLNNSPVILRFNAPVPREQALKIRLLEHSGKEEPGGKEHAPQPMSEEEEESSTTTQLSFPGPFTIGNELVVQLPDPLVDDAGRAFTSERKHPDRLKIIAKPLPFATFPAPSGLIRAGEGAALPVTLAASRNPAAEVSVQRLRIRQAREMASWVRRIREKWSDLKRIEEYSHSIKGHPLLDGPPPEILEPLHLPVPEGEQSESRVVGLPFSRPGYYVLELTGPPLASDLYPKEIPFHVRTAVVVTNLAVHFKQGREASLIWVTSLDRGTPVADAKVTLSDCAGKSVFSGRTDLQGLARLPSPLPDMQHQEKCAQTGESFLITARLGEDESFLLSEGNEELRLTPFVLPHQHLQNEEQVTTLFDRTLLRAGETVSMKHLLRRGSSSGVELFPPDLLPDHGVLRHEDSEQEYPLPPLRWDQAQTALSQWTIPAEAKAGTYDVVLNSKTRGRTFHAGSFQVEQFRVPTMKAELTPLTNTPIRPERVAFRLQVGYLSGASAGFMPVKLRGKIKPRAVHFPEYSGYTLANGSITEGVTEERYPPRPTFSDPQNQEVTLNAAGSAEAAFGNLPTPEIPLELMTELEYQDANGGRLQTSSTLNLHPSRIVLGIKNEARRSAAEPIRLQVVTLDPSGQPVAGIPVAVELLERKTIQTSKRLKGGFYGYSRKYVTRRVQALCSGSSDEEGRLSCSGQTPLTQGLIVQARATDEQGNGAVAHQEVRQWNIRGKENTPTLKLIPDKRQYLPGEMAEVRVESPFPHATLLVTTEREGVLEATLHTLTPQDSTLRIPIRAAHAPNLYLSVLAVQGGEQAPQAEPVETGAPFGLGYVELPVSWKPHELLVKVTTDRTKYRVREQAVATLQVSTASGLPLPEGAEVALAVVDEGLLEMKENDSWQLLPFMMQPRGLNVRTFSVLKALLPAVEDMDRVKKVWRGHLAAGETMGSNLAGAPGVVRRERPDQGVDRHLLETLLLWQGRVKLDARGQARVTIPLNDVVTSFRVVAVAHAGVGLFGTGATSLQVTRELALFSGLPALVREGDRYQAGVTLLNSSDQPLQATVHASVTMPERKDKAFDHPPQNVALPPGASREIVWETEAPMEARRLQWRFQAKAGALEDRLTLSQEVIPTVPVRTFQSTLTSLEHPREIPVQRPDSALPERGGVRLHFQDSLVGSLDGVREFMAEYPYTCLEQKASKAVVLQDEKAWGALMEQLPSYLDEHGLAKYFPGALSGSDALTAYLLALAQENSWEIPAPELDRMTSGLHAFLKEERVPELPGPDLLPRRLAAMEALARHGEISGETLQTVTGDPNLWPSSALIDWFTLLTRVKEAPGRERKRQEAMEILRARLHLQGTTLGFARERRDHLWWLMVSPESNAQRLILAMLDESGWREDLPRLVRGALGVQNKGHWSTTTANAWGVLAMKRFTQKFEAKPVTGKSSGRLGQAVRHIDWKKSPKGKTEEDLPWPVNPLSLFLEHAGRGLPWVTVNSRAAIPLKEPVFSGYHLRRTVSAVERKQEGVWHRGDVMRVRLEIDAQAEMGWVVVNDPIPAGSAILGSGLGTDSAILTHKEPRWYGPTHVERTFEAFRAYYQWMPDGIRNLEYVLRLDTPGTFTLPPARAEAMYAPERMGELPLDPVTILP